MSTQTEPAIRSVRALHEKLKNGETTSVSLVEQSYQRIQDVDSKVGAFLSLDKENALIRAAKIDEQFKKGDTLSPLAGIPIAIKDNINIKGQKTTCGSQFLKDFVSPYNATVIDKLNQAGMVSVGKLNMDEFAMGSSTENSSFQPTQNPWNLEYIPGGSSGGSAAVVAADETLLSLGSDTGGSIRQPAAFCGVVGLKPTYGRVSRYGLVAFASSLDQIGPFAHTVEDAALLYQAISGWDPADSTSAKKEVDDYTSGIPVGVKGLKIAVPEELFGDFIDPSVKQKVTEALDTLKAEGATWEMVSMPALKAAIATYYIVAPAEASANLSRFDGVRYTSRDHTAKNLMDMYTQSRGQGFGDEVKRRIIIGTFALSSGYYDAYYLKAQKARTLIKQAFDEVYKTYDMVLSPTTPTTAFKAGEKTKDPLSMYLSDIATIPANMAGLPALSVPCGFVDGLPVGLQLVGRSFDETTLFKAAHTYQECTSFHTQRPTL